MEQIQFTHDGVGSREEFGRIHAIQGDVGIWSYVYEDAFGKSYIGTIQSHEATGVIGLFKEICEDLEGKGA